MRLYKNIDIPKRCIRLSFKTKNPMTFIFTHPCPLPRGEFAVETHDRASLQEGIKGVGLFIG